MVLPVFNEEKALEPLFERFRAVARRESLDMRFVVVDDGSTDGSLGAVRQFAADLAVEVLRHETNRGLGETIQDGLRLAAARAGPEDIVITMDADNTHPPELIPAMIERLRGGCDVAIASRYRASARVVGLSRFRRWMSEGARVLFRMAAPVPGVRDYTCGFRAYKAGVLRGVLAESGGRLARERGFACMAEILLRFAAAGAVMGEVPFELRYDLKGGASKMNVPATVGKILLLALRWRFGAARAKPQHAPHEPTGQGNQPRP